MAKEEKATDASKGKGKEPVKDEASAPNGAAKGKDGKDDVELPPGQSTQRIHQGLD